MTSRLSATPAETVLRLRKRLLRQIHRASGDFHLLGSSREVEQRSPNLVIDTTAQIFQLRSCLLECGLGLQDIPVYFSALKQWNGNRTSHVKCAIGSGGIDPNISVVRLQIGAGIIAGSGSLASKLGGANATQSCSII